MNKQQIEEKLIVQNQEDIRAEIILSTTQTDNEEQIGQNDVSANLLNENVTIQQIGLTNQQSESFYAGTVSVPELLVKEDEIQKLENGNAVVFYKGELLRHLSRAQKDKWDEKLFLTNMFYTLKKFRVTRADNLILSKIAKKLTSAEAYKLKQKFISCECCDYGYGGYKSTGFKSMYRNEGVFCLDNVFALCDDEAIDALQILNFIRSGATSVENGYEVLENAMELLGRLDLVEHIKRIKKVVIYNK